MLSFFQAQAQTQTQTPAPTQPQPGTSVLRASPEVGRRPSSRANAGSSSTAPVGATGLSTVASGGVSAMESAEATPATPQPQPQPSSDSTLLVASSAPNSINATETTNTTTIATDPGLRAYLNSLPPRRTLYDLHRSLGGDFSVYTARYDGYT